MVEAVSGEQAGMMGSGGTGGQSAPKRLSNGKFLATNQENEARKEGKMENVEENE